MPRHTNAGPVADERQPESKPLLPAGPTPQVGPSRLPPTSPIEAQIAKRLESVQSRMLRVQTRVVDIEKEARARRGEFDPMAFLKSLPSVASGLAQGVVDPRKLRLPTVRGVQNPDAEIISQELEALKREAVSLSQEAQKISTQLLLAQAIPGLVFSGSVETPEDLFTKFSDVITDPEDTALAKRSFDAAIAIQKRLQQSTSKDPQEFLKALGSKRNITVYGLTALASSPDPVGLINSLRAPQLPEGATIEEMRQVFGDALIPSESSAEFLKQQEDFSIVIRQELDTLRTRSVMWQADIINAIDNGGFAQEIEKFKGDISFLDNPGLYIGLPLDWMSKNYWKPLAGSALKNAQFVASVLPSGVPTIAIPGVGPLNTNAIDSFLGVSPEQSAQFDLEYRKAIVSGENFWRAYGVAFENTDVNAVTKLAIELIADPTTYFGFGVVTKIAHPIPILNTAVRASEQAFMRTMDLPFIALQKGLARVIPKLPGHIAARDAMKHVQVVADYLNTAPPRGVPFQQMGMTRIREHMQLALDVLQRNPQDSGTITNAVRGLLERPMITTEEASLLARGLDSSILPGTGSDMIGFVSDLDGILSHSNALPGGMSQVAEETIDLILSKAGVVRTEQTVKVVSDLIRTQRQQAIQRFNSILNASDVKDFIQKIIEHRRFVLGNNQRNPLSAYRSQSAMLMARFARGQGRGAALAGVAGIFHTVNSISVGWTRMYLMSVGYGPFNVLETAAKSVALNINPRFKGKPIMQLQANMRGFETLAPDIFLTADTFIAQAQNITTAGATSRARTTGTRNAFRRIWRGKQSVLRKLYASADEAFIQTSGRLGLDQAAHVLNSLITRHLYNNAQTRPVVEELTNLVAARTSGLKAHMTDGLVEVHQQEMLRLSIQDPVALETFAADFVPGYAHSVKVQELLSKYNTIDPAVREHLTDLAISNDLFRLLRSGELNERITEAIWQQIMAEPAVFLARIRELTKAIIDTPPANLQDLQVQIRMLEDLSSATAHTVEQQMSATQAYTRDILDLEKKDEVWKDQWANIIQPVMESADDAARQVVESLRQSLRAGGFDIPQQTITQYDDLINSQLIRMQLITKARTAINDFIQIMLVERDTVIIPRIRRSGGRPNSDHPDIRDWWERFNSGRDLIWKDIQGEIAESTADISAIAGSLDSLPLPQPKDVSGAPLVMNDVAYLYGVSPDSVTQGMYLADLKMMRSKPEWVNVVYSQARRVARQVGADPEGLGFTKTRLATLYDEHLKSIRIRPEVDALAQPRFVEWQALQSELQTYAMGKDIILKPSATQALDDMAKGLLTDIKASPVAREVEGSDWMGKRRGAFQDAVDEYNITFPVYDQPNVINAGLRFLFPFWTYEAHRWSYLPRIAMKNPGLTHAWGLYNNDTDRGYIPLPGVPLQANFLRNSIMMGGMQRAVNRDFPEFADQFPGFANGLDVMGRVGFYPTPIVSFAMASKWSNKARQWQTGEVIPPPIGSALESIIAIDPDNPFSNALAEIILPNRFRDYRVSIRMAMMLPDGQGSRASEILYKKLRGETFTPEETQIWESAEQRASLDSIFDYQIGMTRLRPDELIAARKLTKQIILRYVPITEEQYDETRKLGMPIEQYYPFPPELNDELRAVEETDRWRGLASHLGESDVAQMLGKQRDYWQRVEDRRTDVTAREVELDRQYSMLGEGHITQKDWEREKRKLGVEMNRFIEDLKASNDFKDVPIEYQDRIEFARRHNTLAPIQHPLEEVVTFYFSLSPEDFQSYDPEVGARVTDWDGFYKWKSNIEDSLPGDDRARFMDRIRKWDTDLDGFRRADYETFIRPYKAMFGVTLAEFTPDEQSVIRQFYAAENINVRDALRDVESGGGKLVSGFQSILSERKKRFRLLDPEVDARLAFWDGATTVASENARSIYNGLFSRYGIQSPEEVLVENISLAPTS